MIRNFMKLYHVQNDKWKKYGVMLQSKRLGQNMKTKPFKKLTNLQKLSYS